MQGAGSAAGDGTLTFAPNVSLAAVTDDVKQAAAAVRAMAAAVNATQAILAPLTSPAVTVPSSGSAATLPRTPAEVSVRARAALEELFMAVTAAGDALTGHSTLNKVPTNMFQIIFLNACIDTYTRKAHPHMCPLMHVLGHMHSELHL